MTLEVVLFQALREVSALDLPSGVPSSGTKFEDFMVQQLYQFLRSRGGRSVYPPRHTLRQPTHSGVVHQYDIVVRESRLIAIECKFRKRTGIDHLFAFLGKLKDYRDPPRGIFVTTAQTVNDDSYCYAMAHRITLICSCLAPVEYMIHQVRRDTDLARRLRSLQVHLQAPAVPSHVLVQWQNEHRRFLAEGYS